MCSALLSGAAIRRLLLVMNLFQPALKYLAVIIAGHEIMSG